MMQDHQFHIDVGTGPGKGLFAHDPDQTNLEVRTLGSRLEICDGKTPILSEVDACIADCLQSSQPKQ